MKKHVIAVTFIMLFCFGRLSAGPQNVSLDIEFSYPGDDGIVGTASLIEWRYTADTLLAWDQWVLITDTMTPLESPSWDTVSFDIEFPDNGVYWIAIRGQDEALMWTDICVKNELNLPDITAPSCGTSRIIGVTRK